MQNPETGKAFRIHNRDIGLAHPPFIIAEMSGNHNQSLERALALVDAAAAAGAHALKIQTFTPDSMTLNLERDEFVISNPKSLWKGRSFYSVYAEAQTPMEWHKPIFERGRAHGMIVFSTPFDAAAVDFLETLDSPCYKIASFELVDLPLIRKVASTGKPLIMSTGMATAAEIDEAVTAARGAGAKHLVLLKCTSTYPAMPENSHLRTIPELRRVYGCEAGLSDHTLGIGAAVASVALGATVIEKHFTLNRSDGGVDSAFSLEPAELKALVDETARAHMALGEVRFGPTPDEARAVLSRRSLYICADLKEGDVLTPENLRSIRPGHGLPPKHYDSLLGKRVSRAVRLGTPMSWDLVG